MTKGSHIYCPECGTRNRRNSTKCTACGHKLPTSSISWLEIIGTLTLLFLGYRLLFTLLPNRSDVQTQPTRQPTQVHQSYEDLEATTEADRHDYEDAQATRVRVFAATAQADQLQDKAETTTEGLGQSAPLHDLDNCVHWTDASTYVGHDTCVYGDVYSTYDSGNAFFINFSRDETTFYAVSFDWVWEDLQDTCVVIYGAIGTYEGRPQIIIRAADQLQDCY